MSAIGEERTSGGAGAGCLGSTVGRWLREGWLIAVAYIFGFFVMLSILGWHPDAPHKKRVDLPTQNIQILMAGHGIWGR